MAKRVEICGIDTSSLPKLSHEKSMDLLRAAQKGDETAKNEFITANLRLVLSVIRRFYDKRESLDDVFQVGCIGLIKAADKFNTELNLRFSTYAVPMIIGEIRRFLRDCSAMRVSRSIRDTAYKVITARSKIEHELSREATLDEIAAALDMPVAKVSDALDAISDPVSLFDPVYHDGAETVMIMDQIPDKTSSDEKWVGNVILDQAIESLEEREREILMLRFYEGKTQMEVSEEIGISQAQVSRLEKNAKASLKEMINR